VNPRAKLGGLGVVLLRGDKAWLPLMPDPPVTGSRGESVWLELLVCAAGDALGMGVRLWLVDDVARDV
jgi:hypothetical protein